MRKDGRKMMRWRKDKLERRKSKEKEGREAWERDH